MINNGSLKRFLGKKAHLLLDGREVPIFESGGQSIEAIAQIANDQEDHGDIKVDSIEYNLYEGSESKKRSFGQGYIEKRYVIGIFEPQKESE